LCASIVGNLLKYLKISKYNKHLIKKVSDFVGLEGDQKNMRNKIGNPICNNIQSNTNAKGSKCLIQEQALQNDEDISHKHGHSNHYKLA
jgi:hypothetical protein